MYAYMKLQCTLVMECLIAHVTHKYVPSTTYAFLSFHILLMPEIIFTHTRRTWTIHTHHARVDVHLKYAGKSEEREKYKVKIFGCVRNSNLQI